ncbi:hypothetical protein L798_13205 [Zootermopsis nevadensis]|uniref:Transmembrane protein n=2 Tax=Zootermopsis nevadensis TaxID=136037 RepID=A0A067QTD9_ZOONE|nr:hypothetical protein L798_13205 [Zootermopsis nevadensis]
MSGESDPSPSSMASPQDILVVKSPGDSFSSTLQTRSSTLSGSFRGEASSEENAFLFLGVAQMLLGVLMAVFGVLAIVHESSLSGVGAGLWGGAVAMATGVVGVLAGLRSCYSVTESSPSRLAVTAFLALCLISLAVSNLVVVLSVIGLVRDGQSADVRAIQKENVKSDTDINDGPNWAPLLASCGLLLMACAQCLVTIVSGFRCYRQVCPCARRRDEKQPLPDSPEPAGSFYSTSSKETLISDWLGQQRRQNVLLITQPPVQGPCGPIFTLQAPPPVPPPSVIGYHLPNAPFLNPLVPPHYMMSRPVKTLGGTAERTKCLRDHNIVRRGRRGTNKRKHGSAASVPVEHQRPVTEEEVAQTYTGLDREIAEEFITIAMESGTGKSKQPVPEMNTDRGR